LKFVEKTYRRAVVRVRGRMYGAILVDLPCVVESMKSFDKKGWWKVADVTQMLLVLGRCSSEDEARSLPLPREINKDTFQYAHGLTPPMHWVRKRRFRKRLNYTQVQNVEEEVAKLLEQDRQWEESGGTVVSETMSRMEMERSQEPQEYDDDEDAEGEAVATVETDQYEEEMDEDEPDEDLEADLQAMFDDEDDAAMPVSDLVTESPAPLGDQAASMAAVESAMPSEAPTPISTPAGDVAQTSASEDEDDEEEDSDDDSIDDVDEDAVARAAEKAQQREEVADLEREVAKVRQKANAMTNQILKQRELQKLARLEEDLRVKKSVFGLNDEDEEE
jgi:transcription initiation factor TFIID subunit 7